MPGGNIIELTWLHTFRHLLWDYYDVVNHVNPKIKHHFGFMKLGMPLAMGSLGLPP